MVRPTLELKEKALDYRKEHFGQGEKNIYGSELFDKTESYEEWLSAVTLNNDPKTVNENWVVTDTFFAVRVSDNRIIGMIDFQGYKQVDRKILTQAIAETCGTMLNPPAKLLGINGILKYGSCHLAEISLYCRKCLSKTGSRCMQGKK